jgi:hypothetical protein
MELEMTLAERQTRGRNCSEPELHPTKRSSRITERAGIRKQDERGTSAYKGAAWNTGRNSQGTARGFKLFGGRSVIIFRIGRAGILEMVNDSKCHSRPVKFQIAEADFDQQGEMRYQNSPYFDGLVFGNTMLQEPDVNGKNISTCTSEKLSLGTVDLPLGTFEGNLWQRARDNIGI